MEDIYALYGYLNSSNNLRREDFEIKSEIEKAFKELYERTYKVLGKEYDESKTLLHMARVILMEYNKPYPNSLNAYMDGNLTTPESVKILKELIDSYKPLFSGHRKEQCNEKIL